MKHLLDFSKALRYDTSSLLHGQKAIAWLLLLLSLFQPNAALAASIVSPSSRQVPRTATAGDGQPALSALSMIEASAGKLWRSVFADASSEVASTPELSTLESVDPAVDPVALPV
ncbi:MAG TPA: hypothetical protein VF747_10170, partial [Blastocatellia bacterium]